MARCQHCKKLTHSEDLIIYYDIEDQEKVNELTVLTNWTSVYMYSIHSAHNSGEYGKLQCGDICIRFRVKNDR